MDSEKGIFQFMVLDAVAIQLAGESAVTVEVDLKRKREPCGDSQMHKNWEKAISRLPFSVCAGNRNRIGEVLGNG